MKKNRISKNWINKQRRDIYVRQSKIEGYRSRAVYKLKEINDKFKILRNGQSIVDLGGAPGSWSQYISSTLKNTRLLSIDLLEIQEIKNVKLIKGDFTDDVYKQKIKSFVTEATDTQKVYSADFKFEPIVGGIYFLYQGNENTFLSLIEPSQWNKKHLGTFRLNGEYKWERI